MFRVFVILLCASAAAPADTAAVRAEPNLEKRSALALEELDAELDNARKAYQEGSTAAFEGHVNSAAEMAELSYQSLQETGKRARRSPKWFKRAEQKLLVILRRIDSLERDVSLDDRKIVENLRRRVRDVQEKVLQDIMSKK